jgi:hypothetical protein
MQFINKPVEQGVALVRVRDLEGETIQTNVPHNIVYHSPTGFEWGYGGSGPAELALNLAELVIKKAGLETEQGIDCSILAWEVKHNVKTLIVEPLNQDGPHNIPWKLVCYAVFDALPVSNREYLFNRIQLLEYIGEL